MGAAVKITDGIKKSSYGPCVGFVLWALIWGNGMQPECIGIKIGGPCQRAPWVRIDGQPDKSTQRAPCRPHSYRTGSKYPNVRVLGPKYYTYYGFWRPCATICGYFDPPGMVWERLSGPCIYSMAT